jgi:hypothetical protein
MNLILFYTLYQLHVISEDLLETMSGIQPSKSSGGERALGLLKANIITPSIAEYRLRSVAPIS